MVRFFVLLLTICGLSLAATPAIAGAGECGSASSALGCPNVSGAFGSNSVELVGTEEVAGSAGHGSTQSQGPLWNGPRTRPGLSCLLHTFNDPSCLPAEPGVGPITIRDIASFIPTPGRQQMQPDGWTVAGLDTNFYAITEQHVVPGTLLGRPADVRFTPTAFHWNYGDGTSATKPTKGGTWQALGLAEFDPTPTSHVYEGLGDYTISLSITFSAEYRFDGSAWRGVVGTLTLPANDLYLRVGTAKTVLVEHDCLANPSGPGC
jgi:hypothetical protein